MRRRRSGVNGTTHADNGTKSHSDRSGNDNKSSSESNSENERRRRKAARAVRLARELSIDNWVESPAHINPNKGGRRTSRKRSQSGDISRRETRRSSSNSRSPYSRRQNGTAGISGSSANEDEDEEEEEEEEVEEEEEEEEAEDEDEDEDEDDEDENEGEDDENEEDDSRGRSRRRNLPKGATPDSQRATRHRKPTQRFVPGDDEEDEDEKDDSEDEGMKSESGGRIRSARRSRSVRSSSGNNVGHEEGSISPGKVDRLRRRVYGHRRSSRLSKKEEVFSSQESGEEDEDDDDEEEDDDDDENEMEDENPSRRPGLRPRRRAVSDNGSVSPTKKKKVKSTSGGGGEGQRQGGYSLRRKRSNVDRFSPVTYHSQAQKDNPSHSRSSFGGYGGRNNRAKMPTGRRGETLSDRVRRMAMHLRAQNNRFSDASSNSDVDDFEKRRKRSMDKRRSNIRPVNLRDLHPSAAVAAAGGSGKGADIDPMHVDTSIDWSKVGGLEHHVKSLKESMMLPLLYPEFFSQFNITPPKGVLFHGPPGTGKTLVARALANTCSQTSGAKVAFYMRKGADCLSKWVGEAERQLRLLFDEAFKNRPSIIFFDEIDGLAPVRSSRQDQIHNSIVSTLLALMDGIDSRGQVVVIGATNRIDSVDPALRRPGRFDRELSFPLPTKDGRKEIFDIHTKGWPLTPELRKMVADKSVGYGGSDLKALATESALSALRRTYPQIYNSDAKLIIDVDKVAITPHDVHHAMSKVKPAYLRVTRSYARPIPPNLNPFLNPLLEKVLPLLQASFPSKATLATAPTTTLPIVHRPRLLLSSDEDNGQHALAGAILQTFDDTPVFPLDLPSLVSDVNSRSTEEALCRLIHEAVKASPSILFIPRICEWWSVASEALRSMLVMCLEDIPPDLPVLLLATSNQKYQSLSNSSLVSFDVEDVFELSHPTISQRRELFDYVVNKLKDDIVVPPRKTAKLEVLKTAPKAPKRVNEEDQKREKRYHHAKLRALRIFLRDLCHKLLREKKFKIFAEPVNDEDVPDYYDVIKHPMDLTMVLSAVDAQQYRCMSEFTQDIETIAKNAFEYNDFHNDNQHIRSRARALQDAVLDYVDNFADGFLGLDIPYLEEMAKKGPASQRHTSVATGAHAYVIERRTRGSARLRGEQIDWPPPDVMEIVATRRSTRASGRVVKDTEGGDAGQGCADESEEKKDNVDEMEDVHEVVKEGKQDEDEDEEEKEQEKENGNENENDNEKEKEKENNENGDGDSEGETEEQQDKSKIAPKQLNGNDNAFDGDGDGDGEDVKSSARKKRLRFDESGEEEGGEEGAQTTKKVKGNNDDEVEGSGAEAAPNGDVGEVKETEMNDDDGQESEDNPEDYMPQTLSTIVPTEAIEKFFSFTVHRTEGWNLRSLEGLLAKLERVARNDCLNPDKTATIQAMYNTVELALAC